jgi:hypothetical protein
MSLEAAVGRLAEENANRLVRHKPKPLAVAGAAAAAGDDY